MTNFRKSTIWSVVLFVIIFSACHHDENVLTNQSESFTPGRLATVLVSKDYEVNFWELSPGNIAVDIYRSVEADKQYSGLVTKLYGANYVDMYKMLAGTNADKSYVTKLEAAELRYKRNVKLGIVPKAPTNFFLRSSFDKDASQPAGRTAATCQNGNGADYYLSHGYCNPPWGCNLNVAPLPDGIGIGSTPNQTWKIDILNGQKSNSGNVIFVSHPGINGGLVNPWTIRTVTMRYNTSGLLTYYFNNDPNLKCATTQYSYTLINK